MNLTDVKVNDTQEFVQIIPNRSSSIEDMWQVRWVTELGRAGLAVLGLNRRSLCSCVACEKVSVCLEVTARLCTAGIGSDQHIQSEGENLNWQLTEAKWESKLHNRCTGSFWSE